MQLEAEMFMRTQGVLKRYNFKNDVGYVRTRPD